jgi:hypothetical protein
MQFAVAGRRWTTLCGLATGESGRPRLNNQGNSASPNELSRWKGRELDWASYYSQLHVEMKMRAI